MSVNLDDARAAVLRSDQAQAEQPVESLGAAVHRAAITPLRDALRALIQEVEGTRADCLVLSPAEAARALAFIGHVAIEDCSAEDLALAGKLTAAAHKRPASEEPGR